MNISYTFEGNEFPKNNIYRITDIYAVEKIINDFDWNKTYESISENLEKEELFTDYDSIKFINSKNINLVISSFDKGIYIAELIEEKKGLLKKKNLLLNGSPKLTIENLIQIINYYAVNDITNINKILDETRENEKFKLGRNAIEIKQKTELYFKNLETDYRIKKLSDKKNDLKIYSIIFIAFGLFLLYIMLFKYTENEIIFEIAIYLVISLMIIGGTISLIKNFKTINN